MAIPKQLAELKVDLKDLQPYHKNPRRGDVDAIVESLQLNGQYRPIVVNLGTLTGRDNEVAAGNHTYHAAKRLRWKKIAATFIDVDDDALAKIVLVDNRTSDLGEYYDQELADMLTQLQEESKTGLAGTGWSELDASRLLERLGDGDRATSFLSDFIGEVDSEQYITSADGTELVKISYLVTVNERDLIKTALELAKTIIASSVSSDALVAVAKHYTGSKK
jgi:Arc/MetJ family transcription regulator